MASASIWKDNKVLKKWLKKYQLEFVDGNFNYDLTDLLSDPLLITISEKLAIDKEYIYLGAGSSQLITTLINLRMWNKIFITTPEFGLYERNIIENKLNSKMIESLTTDDFITKLKKEKSSKDDLLCISSPKWFSGELFSNEQINEILEIFKGTILVDEAYIAFSDNSKGLIDLALNNNRIMLLRSFSKTFFASGFRIGYLITKKKINGLRNTFIAPHSISTYSERFAVKLLNDEKLMTIFKNSIEYMKYNRDILYQELIKDNNIIVYNSQSNFITLLFKDLKTQEEYYSRLKNLPGIQSFTKDNINYIKIWISNEKYNQEVLKRIKY